jgi:glycosyltransferase involved in cell wall biosynthesis
MSLRVVIDALSAHASGGLTFITNQVSALERVRPDITLRVLATPRNHEVLRSAIASEIREINVRNVARRVLYEQFVMSRHARGADVIYCPANFCPLKSRRPVVLTVQNIHYFGRSRSHPANRSLRRRLEALLCNLSITRAAAVISVSHALLAEIQRDGLSTRNVRVIHSGVPPLPQEAVSPFRTVLKGGYFLSVAGDLRHKRVADAVRAWSRVLPDMMIPLVLVGDFSPRSQAELWSLVPPVAKHRILFLGRLADKRVLRWLYDHAAALIATSELESFGLPLLEAGSVGCPVLATDIPAHKEVAGSNATYFPVGSITALAEQITRIMASPPERSVWLPLTTWEENAEKLGRLFEQVVKESSNR